MPIYDTMQYVRCNVSTICVGQAASEEEVRPTQADGPEVGPSHGQRPSAGSLGRPPEQLSLAATTLRPRFTVWRFSGTIPK